MVQTSSITSGMGKSADSEEIGTISYFRNEINPSLDSELPGYILLSL